jgi:hypothetical protein
MLIQRSVVLAIDGKQLVYLDITIPFLHAMISSNERRRLQIENGSPAIEQPPARYCRVD